MKPTIKLLAHQKLLTLLTTLLILIESLGKVTSSLTLAPLTDQLINKNFRGVFFWLLATISIWGVTLTIAYVNSLLKAQIIRKVTNQLRTDIANGLTSIPVYEYNKVNHNEYVSWLTNDINMIEQNGLQTFFSLLGNAATLLFAITSFGLLPLQSSLCCHYPGPPHHDHPTIFLKSYDTRNEPDRFCQ